MASDGAWALLPEEVDQFLRAGDILAEMLGHATATIESGDGFDDTQLQAARDGIVIWHRMRSTSNGRT